MEHYRDEVFVCKSDSGLWLALLPAFVKEDTQPIAEIPIQKMEKSQKMEKKTSNNIKQTKTLDQLIIPEHSTQSFPIQYHAHT